MGIRFENISKKYENLLVLCNINSEFACKETTFIIGQSGVGKTTFLRILLGLETPDSGSITGMEEKKVSVVFQNDALCSNLSVYLNLKLVTDNLSESDYTKSLKDIGLEDCLYKRVRELSGGMKRRVAILRALLIDFDVIVMDEPFRGLDMETKHRVMDFVIEKTKNKTVIIVTHDLEEINYFKEHRKINVMGLGGL